MALLDIQAMDAADTECEDHHHGGGSAVSLLLCASEASITLC